jgi:hypothetical protein
MMDYQKIDQLKMLFDLFIQVPDDRAMSHFYVHLMNYNKLKADLHRGKIEELI